MELELIIILSNLFLIDNRIGKIFWWSIIKKIIKLYYFKSKRWDIETSEGYLIKLSRNYVKKDLNLFVRLSNENKLKDEFVIDFRQKDQIILNGK